MSYSDEPVDALAGFEDGVPVPIYRGPEPDDSERLCEILEEAGMPAPLVPGAIRSIEAYVDRMANVRAAEAIHHLVRCLEGTAAAAALQRVMLGDTQPAREVAAEIGCTHTAILRQEAKIRAKLAGGFPRSR